LIRSHLELRQKCLQVPTHSEEFRISPVELSPAIGMYVDIYSKINKMPTTFRTSLFPCRRGKKFTTPAPCSREDLNLHLSLDLWLNEHINR
jgi:CxxC motif-containing protein (DUF1111 family)